jgi:hypothetical protein
MSGWKKELGVTSLLLMSTHMPQSLSGPKVRSSHTAVPDNASWPPELEAAMHWKPHARRAKEKRFGNEGAVWKGTIRVR